VLILDRIESPSVVSTAVNIDYALILDRIESVFRPYRIMYDIKTC